MLTSMPVSHDIILSVNHVPFDIVQNTPLRVLHRYGCLVRCTNLYIRRAPGKRSRRIYDIYVSCIHATDTLCAYSVEMTTQAGTYVKEFVNGDYSRTKPSLGDMLHVECDLSKLDVMGIDLVFPPVADSTPNELQAPDVTPNELQAPGGTLNELRAPGGTLNELQAPVVPVINDNDVVV